MTKIVLFKLTTGEEIIAKQVDNHGNKVVLNDVRALVIQPQGNGHFGIAMVPWLAGSPDGEVELDLSNVLATPLKGAPKHLEDAYLQQTTGIDLAGSSARLDLSKR